MSDDQKGLQAVCTKCGHCEAGDNLSRFCPRCNYMRLVRKPGETEDQGRARSAAPLTDEERQSIFNKSYRPKPALWVPQ